ncbi:LD-carboxypeptidase [Ginsengibacter hankyongi]|uniref:LD-carboxypeptidase n=1 Tax=Ginsengibacter hankyongi TaxID=2607284 RepID=A0A5J5IKZ8_9BACT|nr:LD-carboxypeptidase [Ginsengibacter hankyongi]KAA9041411.1 LD-carboxypeptidase [Ginsengibacter hankyongi]
MNRKNFLSSIVPLAASVSAVAKGGGDLNNSCAIFEENKISKIPPYLKPGDVIGITCPSGYISFEEIQPAIDKLKEWGFQVRIGHTVGTRDFSFAGNDEYRVEDFQNIIDDDSVKAVLLGRGGYGAVRIIDAIDFKKFAKHPKWIIGFSDATVFHSHINKNFGIATIHSKMCNSFPSDWSSATPGQIDSIDSIRKCLTGENIQYPVAVNTFNKTGAAEGILVGGNLSILQNLAATRSDINTDDKILLIEEVDEYLYSIDRMLCNLQRSGKLQNLKALIAGGFNNIKPDDPSDNFGKTVYEIILEKVKEYNYPVCFDFPVGHQRENYAVKCGVKYRLNVSDNSVTLNQV